MDIYGIGRNYINHIRELKNQVPKTPVVFLKASSCLRPLKNDENAPSFNHDYEAEIVLKMGRDCYVGETVTNAAVSHMALGLDLTRRDVQTTLKSKGLPWTEAKSFIGSAICGPFIPFEDSPLEFTLHVEGVLKQRGNSSEMIFSFEQILNHLLSFTNLKKGDLIYTGTPEGTGLAKKGESFRLSMVRNNYHCEGRF